LNGNLRFCENDLKYQTLKENGVDTLKLHHDTLSKTLKKHSTAVNQMTMIYDPIPFVKIIQNISVGNCEPIHAYLRENIYN